MKERLLELDVGHGARTNFRLLELDVGHGARTNFRSCIS